MSAVSPVYVVGDPATTDVAAACTVALATLPAFGELVEAITLWPDGSCDLNLIGGYVVQVAPDGQRFTYPEIPVSWALRLRLGARSVFLRMMRRGTPTSPSPLEA